MKAMATKYGGVASRLAGPMTRAQALRLKGLADEAHQPEQYATDLSFDEAARRIDVLKAEIAFILAMWQQGRALTSSCGSAPDQHACGSCRPS
jgi:hypothetical protein